VQPCPLEEVEVESELMAPHGQIPILEHSVKRLRTKIVKLIRVSWENDPVESTWKPEGKIKVSYPELFSSMFPYS